MEEPEEIPVAIGYPLIPDVESRQFVEPGKFKRVETIMRDPESAASAPPVSMKETAGKISIERTLSEETLLVKEQALDREIQSYEEERAKVHQHLRTFYQNNDLDHPALPSYQKASDFLKEAITLLKERTPEARLRAQCRRMEARFYVEAVTSSSQSGTFKLDVLSLINRILKILESVGKEPNKWEPSHIQNMLQVFNQFLLKRSDIQNGDPGLNDIRNEVLRCERILKQK